MPRSVNGIGTKYYGKRDLREDGSYLTTNFFCLFYIPLIPLHSVRVIPDPKNSWLPYTTNYYVILEKRRPNLLQVLNVYLVGAAEVAMAILFFSRFEPLLDQRATPEWVKAILFALTLTPPLLIVFLLQRLTASSAPPKVNADANSPIE